ncbi:hypothetical protein PUNSTDRAFT_75047 [Punctularia strigosozonata HHB-11173 SS5]|uniref:CxC2-like cysteine cluster KDZ transposase-associated domain-containing protein n=1 Tax=Punctularia strigosozonata (strain HHB-11173) TaxID=741275 RepID=R7S4D0_PUNST|nr:uncharacterized protein PUNSTDRAFT_75047 [Punctularia strigosozonata HHB-11173 SS5]EIN05220.1 hypothetical protein PUNSTDRAFT_75047 [Punctularia strigosozonata HHB-11173 SS5]
MRHRFLDILLAQEALPTETPAPCEICLSTTQMGSYRCEDCFGECLMCKDCIVEAHRKLPLHHVQCWDDDCFWPVSLRDLGLEVQLGHRQSETCGNPHSAHQSFIVFDANGYHSVDVKYCACSTTLPFEQLLDVGWYPASTQQPRTVFTFSFLDTFHRLTLQGKVSLHDYYLSVIHKTDNAGLNDTTSRHHEATLVTRQWAHLMALKRAARGHDPLGIEATPNGALVVVCPACPQPGWNIPDDWDKSPPEQRWIYALFLAIDACFRLKNKDRKINDPELGSGWAYYVAEQPYKQHIESYVGEEEVNPCNSAFNAIKHMSSNKSKPGVMSTSGVGAVKCARHALVRPNGVADLQKGEKYATMDYIFWSTLLLLGCALPVVVSYDIACQWKKNRKKRHAAFPASFAALSAITMRFFIPNMHVQGHMLLCQTVMYFLLHEFVGLTHAETIEQEWAHIRGVSTMTQDMGLGARRHTLNDHWGHWNFWKVVKMGDFFFKSLINTLQERARHQRVYEEHTLRFRPELIKKWEDMIHEWELDTKKPNPYNEPEQAVNVTQLRKELADQDAQDAIMNTATLHPTTANIFIRQGFALRDQQWSVDYQAQQLKSNATDTATSSLQERRTALHRSIQEWYNIQNSYMPAAITRHSSHPEGNDEASSIKAENLPIMMPSDIPAPLRIAGCIGGVIDMEKHYATARMKDGLINIRRFLCVRSSVRQKIKHSVGGTGARQGTRSKTLWDGISKKLQQSVNTYRSAYAAVKILDPSGDWSKFYRRLSNDDIRGPYRDDVLDESERRRTPSWIWTAPDASSGSAENDERDADEHMRSEWARQRARSRRCAKEVVLLVEEMRRVLTYIRAKASWWDKQQDQRIEENLCLMRGLNAYARRQSRILTRLGAVFASRWLPLLKIKDLGGEWTSQFDTVQVVFGMCPSFDPIPRRFNSNNS